MDLQRRVQVVLGEAERTDGLLRFILEGEGFDIIGLASDDDELARVLRGARPQVVVLDGGISAPAALEARERAEGASLVVVWPDGVAAVVADERVDPFDSISDLGDAVRRAARTAELAQVSDTSIRVPEVPATPTDEESRAEIRYPVVRREPAMPTRSRGRRGQLLIAATTWILALTALTAIAIGVPNAMDPSPRRGGGRPSTGVSMTPEPDDRTVPERTGVTTRSCDVQARDRTDRSGGKAASEPVLAQGCLSDREQGDPVRKGKGKGKGKGQDESKGQDEGKDQDEGKGQDEGKRQDEGRGRPDDPGSQAAEGRSSNQEPRDGGGPKDGSQGSGGDLLGHGDAGKPETGKAHGPAENAGRSENGNSG